MRIRQLVIAAESGRTADILQRVMDLKEPFKDPGVGEFGLDNAVFALGDQFLEVVWPIADTAPARRFLDRNGGEGGYMAIFETGDIEATRRRAQALGVRAVWSIDLPNISATHFHPSDLGGAIVSIDQPRPAGEWRWGGPDWRSRAAAGSLVGATIRAPDPNVAAAKWAGVLGLTPVAADAGAQLACEGGVLRFEPGPAPELAAFEIELPDFGAACARASELGLETSDASISLGGVVLQSASH